MVKLTESLKEFLFQSEHKEIIPLLMFGHVELFTEEIQREYVEWLAKNQDKEMVKPNGEKKILDACCGSRMFWFNRNNPDVIFADNRQLETTLCDGRTLVIEPDMIIDFRHMPFNDNTFNLVVFDPPHLIHAGQNSWLAKKYGTLPSDWKPYLKAGFDECMRVLKPGHTLIMKWNEQQIKTADMLKAIEHEPLFGDRRSKTRWLCFMKG